jgi:hypothetical protein
MGSAVISINHLVYQLIGLEYAGPDACQELDPLLSGRSARIWATVDLPAAITPVITMIMTVDGDRTGSDE